MSDQSVTISDREVLLRVYEMFRDAADPADGDWALELALLDKMDDDFELAEQFAESQEQRERAIAAKDAMSALREAITNLVAAEDSGPGIKIVDDRRLTST